MSRINVLSFLCVSFALLLVVSAFETSTTNTKDEKKSDTKVDGLVEDVKSGGQGNCGGTCGGGSAGHGGAGGHGGHGGPGGNGGGSGNGGPGGNGGNGGSGGDGGKGGGKGGGCGHQCCDSGGGCKKCCAAGYNVYVVAEDPETVSLTSNSVASGGRCREYCCKWRGGYCAKKCYRCLDKNGVWTEVQESDVQQLGTNYDGAVDTTNSKGGGGK